MPYPPPAFPGMGPTAGPSALDGTPPTPTPMSSPPGGGFSMRGIAGSPVGFGGPEGGPMGGPGGVPAAGMPPEVLTGITSSAQAMSDLIDSWAQITPDKQPQLNLIKDMVAQYLAELMPDGAGAVSPTAAGAGFPGGGMDRGIAGPGTLAA